MRLGKKKVADNRRRTVTGNSSFSKSVNTWAQPRVSERRDALHNQRGKRAKQAPAKRFDAAVIVPNRSVWRLLPSALAMIVIAGSILYALSLDVDSAKVRVVQWDGATFIEQEETTVFNEASYAASFQQQLGDSILNKNKLTIKSGSISEHIESNFPEILAAEVRFGLIDRTPILNIVPREPHLIVEVEDGTKHLLDRDGFSMSEVAATSGLLDELLIINDQVGLQIAHGAQALPQDTIKFIDAVVYQLHSADLTIDSMALPAIANELHVKLAGEAFVGKFDVTADPRTQSGAFIASYRQLSEEDVIPDEYLDVRVDGRVYYR